MIKFTIEGIPVPYLRMTQGQVKLMRIPDHKINSKENLKIKEKIRRYLKWKEYIQFIAMRYDFDRSPKEKLHLDVMIYFPNKKHGDPENIRKGIQDALFKNDKYVVGSSDFDYDYNNPRCEVRIEEK